MQRQHIKPYQYSRTGAVGSCCSLFGNGSGPIHLNYVECSGSETDLSQCVHTEAKNQYCGIYHASSVKCLNVDKATFSSYDPTIPNVQSAIICPSKPGTTATSTHAQTTVVLPTSTETLTATENQITTVMSSPVQTAVVTSQAIQRRNVSLTSFQKTTVTSAPVSSTYVGSSSVKKTTDVPRTSRSTMTSHTEILHFEHVNLTLREGKPAWFKVKVQSNVSCDVKWFHDGTLITSSSTRFTMTSIRKDNDTSHTLHIARVLPRDGGEWTIIASNQEIYATKNFTTTVIPRLKLQMTPQYDFSIALGEEINLQCNVINPNSLNDVVNGSLVLKKDGSVLSDNSFTNFSTMWKTLYAASSHSGRYTCVLSGYDNLLDPVFASVYITVIKPGQIRCEREESEGIMWNTTLAGTTKHEPCPANQKGIASRYCEPSGRWDFPTFVNCTLEAFIDALSQLNEIIEDGIQNTEKVQETVNSSLQMMKNLTTNEISPGDLRSSLNILEKIVYVSNSTGSNIEKEAFYAVIDNVMSTSNTKSWSAFIEQTEKDASSLLKNMEHFSEVVIQKENITAIQFNGSNFGVAINQAKIDETEIHFPDVTSTNPSHDSEESSSFLELPKQKAKFEKAINYVAAIYKTMSTILPSNSDMDPNVDNQDKTSKKAFVNSPILSLTTQPNLGELTPSLNLAFQHINSIETTGMRAVCVSWNFTESKWTEKGCKVNESDHKRTVCRCNHLTNFAILMRPYSPVLEEKQSLKTISLVGMIISLAFTSLTFIIYILTWRSIRSDQNIIMLNLCGSLISSYAIFISVVEQTENEVVCTAITAILHYFFLVTLFSMLGIGVYYFMRISVTSYAMRVASNFGSKSRVHWFLVGIWGIPVIITATNLGVFWRKGYHLKKYCWLSMDGGSLYLFIVPVCLISFLNLLIIVSLVRVLCATSVMTKSSLHKKATAGLRSLGTLLPVLGVTWVFGIMAINEDTDIFQYIFVAANSLQGFFIFVSHVLMNNKVMQGLRNKYPAFSLCKRKTKHRKIESVSISRNKSTTKFDSPLKEDKKSGKFERSRQLKIKKNKVKKSESFMTEKTMYTDFNRSILKENSSVMAINKSAIQRIQKMGIISEGKDTRRMFRWLFSLNTPEENGYGEKYKQLEETS